jgi:hypothetical protein
MIVLGLLLGVWGAAVLGFGPPLHRSWKGMLQKMRRDGVVNDIPGTEFLASERGLRSMQIAGGAALAAGIGLILAGLVQRATG